MHARGTFDIDSWEEETVPNWDGAKLTRALVTKTFHGDLEGTSVAHLLLTVATEGSAAYVGFERIDATVHGKTGTFVLHHSATMSSVGPSASWTVVPDSGTGELEGLRGHAEIVTEADGGHTFTFDYELD